MRFANWMAGICITILALIVLGIVFSSMYDPKADLDRRAKEVATQICREQVIRRQRFDDCSNP